MKPNLLFTRERFIAAATVTSIGILAACGSRVTPQTQEPNPVGASHGILIDGAQISFLNNGDAAVSTHPKDGSDGTTELWRCNNTTLLIDSDPSNHNDSDIMEERQSVTVTVDDPRCADGQLTEKDFS